MHNPQHPHSQNGWSDWPHPSPIELLLRIENRLGGFLKGQEMLLDAIKAAFARINALEEKIADLRAMQTQPPPSPAPEARPGFLTASRELLTAGREFLLAVANLREVAVLVAVLIFGLLGLMSPREVKETLLPAVPAIDAASK